MITVRRPADFGGPNEHGPNMSGRWVGLGYDDQIMTGFASIAHSRDESEEAMNRLISSGGEVARAAE
jgi:hypothetical protein